jgi:hypothetical protein
MNYSNTPATPPGCTGSIQRKTRVSGFAAILARASVVGLTSASLLTGCLDEKDDPPAAVAPPPPPPPPPCTSDCFPNGLDLPNTGPNVVAKWHELGRLTFSPAADPAGATSSERSPTFDLDMPILTLAMYDALALVTGKYRPFTPDIRNALQGTIPTASAAVEQQAASGAACGVLSGLFPLRAAVYESECSSAQAGGDSASLAAFTFGKTVALKVLAWRGDDGRETPLAPYASIASTAPGQFRSLNPNPAVNPVNYVRPYVRTFSLTGASQFRPDPPYALGSIEYTADLAEVRRLGAAGSTTRTEAQTENAKFHTMPPPQFWTKNFLQFATSQPTLVENARLMAALWIALADATTACFEAKYYHLYWRPVTAIQLADLDGNPATAVDPAWQPVVPTPNHPEYPAAHACDAGATAAVLTQIFRTEKLHFSFTTEVATVSEPYRKQNYQSVRDFTGTIGEARIAGGMHYRNSTVQGEALGRKVAQQVLA